MEREILGDLKRWKKSRYRKPLVIQGARQVGKSFVLKQFGKQFFENCCYVNFDNEKEHKSEFAKTKDPFRLVSYLSVVKGIDIKPEKTLIIFDEVQECNEALNSLKYFNEMAPEQAIVCAGSLLGVALKRQGASFPVGNVDFLTLYPVSFTEFLLHYNKRLAVFLTNYVSASKLDEIPEFIHNQLIEAYKVYICCGGMPETIVRYLENKDWHEVDVVNNQILTAYALDFAKHIYSKDIPRLHLLWQNIQDNLAKEDKKFRYALIEKNARAREYENAVEWLVLSGLVNRIYEVQTLRLPVASYKNSSAFKLYMVDAGLLRTKFRLDPKTILQGDKLFTEFKGVLTENYVLQSLVRQFGNEIFFWTSGNQAEIEFILQKGSKIVPVEAKSASSIKSKSLSEYRKKYSPELSIRLSLKNVEQNADLINVPLYLADYLKPLILNP
ncbi:MAG: ATP-binding protein [Prevotellaceae bacterium]|jgi:predicted AAA+ superfamily ATPase|nr:ATP-binding protein [Prevotellaceae bacterium]